MSQTNSVFRAIHVKQVVGADLNELLGRADRCRARQGTSAVVAAVDVYFLGAVADVVVLELDGPVTRQRMFEADADQEAIQRAAEVGPTRIGIQR